MKRFFLAATLAAPILMGCTEPTTVKKANDKWSGTYTGDDLRAIIRKTPEGFTLKLNTQSQNGRCKGSFESEQTTPSPDGQSIAFGSGAPGKAWCEVTIVREDDTLRILEADECGSLHGDACKFDGKVTKVH